MSIQLDPKEYFAIVRQLPNPNDTATYYVRATIRNAKTDALIDTVNLTDRGNRRFSVNWQVIQDVNGLGTYISILTEVFTDSGYTTKSNKYAEEMETYLVETRKRTGLGGGGGGADIDYKIIEKIVEKVVKKYEDAREEPEKVNLSPIGKKLSTIEAIVSEIKIPPQEKPDFMPILKAFDSAVKTLTKKIDDKEVTKVDLSSIESKLDELSIPELQRAVADLNIVFDELHSMTKDLPGYKEKIDALRKEIEAMPFSMVKDFLASMSDSIKQSFVPKKEEKSPMPQRHLQIAQRLGARGR